MLNSMINHQWKAVNLSENQKITKLSLGIPTLPNFDILRNLDLSYSHNVDDACIINLALKCSNVLSLNLSGCYLLSHNAISAIRENMLQLEELDVSECFELDDLAVLDIAQMKNLKFLNIASCDGIMWDHGVFKNYTDLNFTLQSLCARSVVTLTDAAVELIVNLFRGLRILDLSFSAKRLTDLSLDHIAASSIASHLFSLNMWGSDITDDGIDRLTPKVRNLRSLTLSDCKKLTNRSIICIISALKHLTTFNMWSCTGIECFAVYLFLQHLPEIKSIGLSFSNMPDFPIRQLAHCKSLRSLELDDCRQISHVYLQNLESTALQALHLKNCVHITSSSIACIVQKCPNITIIDLTHIPMQESDLLYIVENLKELNRVILSYIESVSDSVVLSLIENHNQSVQTLKLDGCEKLTDKCISKLTRSFPNLKVLSLMFCQQLSDNSLIIKDNSSRWIYLKELYLAGCIKLTGKSIVSIVQRAPKLKTLSIPLVSDIDDEVLTEISSYIPNLEHLNISRAKIPLLKGIKAITERCRFLKALLISHSNISGDVLDYVKDLPLLNSLDIVSCPQFSKSSIEEVVKHCKYLRTIKMSLEKSEDSCTQDQEFIETLKSLNKYLQIG